jgi:CheY-like chemotaxis protein
MSKNGTWIVDNLHRDANEHVVCAGDVPPRPPSRFVRLGSTDGGWRFAAASSRPVIDAGAEPHPTVLVVDDEAAIQGLTARLLRVHGFGSRHASSVEEAITTATHHRVDAVILDLGLRQKQSGLDVLRWLRSNPLYTDTPVLILTGRTAIPVEQQAVISDHRALVLHKPLRHRELIDHLKRALRED